ncbi:hypothetical protein OTERR_12630 [Oryzomicrobium terrae]|uniref:High-potential iron-sulfur protein n=1 Tax=Oryzomicrobium terrae TaxID=1735038 RepID=A0A5C1E812_9RHOO|nr:hypothetical protein [Oryzomicrobium terrae]QEL64739.1 hypothetical protein OTERR_12630 [Oryzomicrobium terrae]
MSKQSEAKKDQGYTAKLLNNCGNCRQFESETITPAWAKGDPDYEKNYAREGNMRCGIGGFAVKKMGSCNEFKKKEAKK